MHQPIHVMPALVAGIHALAIKVDGGTQASNKRVFDAPAVLRTAMPGHDD